MAKTLCASSEATIVSLTSSALLGSARTAACGSTKALSAQIASSREANSTLYRVQPRLSREVKAKALCANSEAAAASLSTTLLGSTKPAACEANTKATFCANSVVDSSPLPLTTPSAKNLCSEARNKVTLGANSEAILTSLEGKAQHGKTKFASKGRTKAAASLCVATLSGENILASPTKKSLQG